MPDYTPPVLGAGYSVYGLTILRGSMGYVGFQNLVAPYGIELLFYSVSGDLVGTLGNTYSNHPYIGHKIKDNLMGGLESMEFTVARIPEFVLYNLMRVEIRVNTVHWFTGELKYTPGQESREREYKYTIRGYSKYLDYKVDELYQNKTLLEIVEDLIETNLQANSPINYNPDKIDLPDVTLTKLEVNNKEIWKAIENIIAIANRNYDSKQYRWYIDRDLDFNISEVGQAPDYGLFEGFQFQNPDVNESIDKIINKISIWRTIEDSDESEYVSSVQDNDSITKYELREDKLIIEDYADQTTAEYIAEQKLSRFKNPITSVKIKNLLLDVNPFPFEFYYIHSKFDSYVFLISEFEKLAEWDLTHIATTSVTVEDETVYTGRQCFKIVTADGSGGEYIEYELEEPIYFPKTFRFFVRQQAKGEVVNILLFDEDGNSFQFEIGMLLKEDGGYLLLENGNRIELEMFETGINIDLIDDWIKIEIDVTSLTNIAKIWIMFVTDDAYTAYIDRLDILADSWKRLTVRLDNIEYVQDRVKHIANAQFGEKILDGIDEIKEINDDTRSLASIFTKKT